MISSSRASLSAGRLSRSTRMEKSLSRLRRDDVGAVLAPEHLLGAVLDKVLVASYLDGDEDFGLGLGGRDVKYDAVEVRDSLVDGRGRCTAPGLAGPWHFHSRSSIPREVSP